MTRHPITTEDERLIPRPAKPVPQPPEKLWTYWGIFPAFLHKITTRLMKELSR